MSNIPTVKQEYDIVIKEDPRFKVSVREFKIAVIFWIAYTIIFGVVAFSLFPKEPVGTTITAGLPTPFFWFGIFLPIIAIIATVLVVNYGFKEVSLDEYEGGEQ